MQKDKEFLKQVRNKGKHQRKRLKNNEITYNKIMKDYFTKEQ